jgi:outer membrane cobalamin receptor
MKHYLFILSLLFCVSVFAQNTVTGKVTGGNNLPIPGANVAVVGDASVGVTNAEGIFTLKTQKSLPFEINITAVGYESKKMSITANNQNVTVVLNEEENKLNEIVVSASRTPERILQSPVTIERMGIQQIKANTSPTVYDGLDNLKDVQINNSSMSFKSINSRGFAAVGNTRFMQIVDGMDNSSPALNFPLGNLVGLSDIDIASVELMPGASSALYGANAFNGILFMNSKSAFKDEGVSGYFRYGQTSQNAAGVNDVLDYGIRAAKVFTKHFAAKANFSYMKASEWIADNTTSITPGGGSSHLTNQNYDGLNVYGDEVTTFIPNVGQVSRTGYLEQDLNDNEVHNLKTDVSLYFKPWNNETEIILQYKMGLGTTIYQGANRYALDNFFMSQTRLEVKGKNFFVRGFITSEDAGDSYNMTFAGWNVNRASKSDTEWFTNYATAFQLSGAVLGTDANQSALNARNYADYNIKPTGLEFLPNPTGQPRYEPGTPEFNEALNMVKNEPDLKVGAKFIDHSRIYNAEGNYNFNDLVKFADIQVGASIRQYEMNSEGTIFTDYDGPLSYNEFGTYVQYMDKYLDNKLKFTGSLRYDKGKNFEGKVSPRVSFVYTTGVNNQNNFRVSYQTGFRNPTTQDQYIGLDIGAFALIGSAPENLDRFTEDRSVSLAGQAIGGPAVVEMSGQDAYNNSYTLTSVQAFGSALTSDPLNVPAAAALLKIANPTLVKPEEVHAFEVGYRAVLDKNLSVDMNVYYNIYNNFMSTSRVVSPYYGDVDTAFDFSDPTTLLPIAALTYGDRRVYQVYTNTSAQITSMGFGIGLSKKVYKDFELGATYNFSEYQFDQSQDPAFIAGFNTPKHMVKGSFGNVNVFKNFGFNFNVRWNTEYVWQSSFGDGIIPENTVMDAQINYAVPSMKSVFKLGGANIFSDEYVQVYGAGNIGQQWFISWTVNM